ncbi:hypothetical protein [Streptomyces sp. NPDC096934]|uniref:hypothetical protein n=1 Tax=Streptomyces sp. NPDC096934 TaxID=3155551 RepID=UPI00332505E5
MSDVEQTDPALNPQWELFALKCACRKWTSWLSNPDGPADELLSKYMANAEVRLLELAGQILDSEEPEVRRYPMLRHHFGAYEPLDDVLTVLRSAGLAARGRRGIVDRFHGPKPAAGAFAV